MSFGGDSSSSSAASSASTHTVTAFVLDGEELRRRLERLTQHLSISEASSSTDPDASAVRTGAEMEEPRDGFVISDHNHRDLVRVVNYSR